MHDFGNGAEVKVNAGNVVNIGNVNGPVQIVNIPSPSNYHPEVEDISDAE